MPTVTRMARAPIPARASMSEKPPEKRGFEASDLNVCMTRWKASFLREDILVFTAIVNLRLVMIFKDIASLAAVVKSIG